MQFNTLLLISALAATALTAPARYPDKEINGFELVKHDKPKPQPHMPLAVADPPTAAFKPIELRQDGKSSKPVDQEAADYEASVRGNAHPR